MTTILNNLLNEVGKKTYPKWTRLVADDRGSCPTGYILVPGSTTFGTKDFCVMKYAAQQDASKNPTSAAAGPLTALTSAK